MRLICDFMAICEVCGSRPAVKRSRLEGAVMEVCAVCGRSAVELPKIPEKLASRQSTPKAMDEEAPLLAANFSKIIREAREKKGMSQAELAGALREKESVIARTERGVTPPIPVARKLEKFFKIKLLCLYEEGKPQASAEGGDDLTLGDVLNVK